MRPRAPPVRRIPTPRASATVAVASRAVKAPVIDGKADDAVWATAQVIDGFRTFDPTENGDPRFRTEARVAYDERNLYVFVRAFDPHPDSIVALLSRRDVRTQSEWLKLIIDGYHDRRTGVELAVNPGGVKRDFAILNDGEEDESWDGVWDVGTRIDSLGWIAEFRIPLNQLRYAGGERHTFGFGIWRDVARYNERYAWPLYSRSKNGLSSQLGDLGGIDGIASPRRLEVSPYSVAKTYNAPVDERLRAARADDDGRGPQVRHHVEPHGRRDGESGLRPGRSRSVGREPLGVRDVLSREAAVLPRGTGSVPLRRELQRRRVLGTVLLAAHRPRRRSCRGTYDDPSNATSSTILGATKLTGRLGNGVSVGVLDAVTQRETAPGRETIEPQTNYFVGRLQRDFRQGASGIGVMVTSVHRNLDQWSSDYLRSNALAGGVDFRHQFLDRNFQVTGYVAQSQVQGSAKSIAQTQLSSVHNYQRPDDGIAFDSTRTSLGGYSAQVSLSQAWRRLDAVQHELADVVAWVRDQRRRLPVAREREESVAVVPVSPEHAARHLSLLELQRQRVDELHLEQHAHRSRRKRQRAHAVQEQHVAARR